LLSLHFQLQQYRDATEVLKKLIVSFPKKSYWMQLAAAYTELDDKKKALATMELAEDQGFLQSENEVRNLIQLYLYNDVPYQAARTIEKAIADGRLPNNAKNQEMLANTWLHAREREKAIGPLERAAEMSGDGNLYVRLGQVHIAEERWGPARAALAKALGKGGVRDAGNVHLMLGIANASESRWDEAKKAFSAARKYDNSATSAGQWLAHIEEELTLDEYEEDLEQRARQRESATSKAVEAATGS
jgi:tetratricopeptide (TPR) repeat protein